jgi:hypothetical protein
VDARSLSESSIAWAVELSHDPSLANTWTSKATLEVLHADAGAVLHAAERAIDISRQSRLAYFLSYGEAYSSYARGRLFDPEVGARELRQALALHLGQGNLCGAPWLWPACRSRSQDRLRRQRAVVRRGRPRARQRDRQSKGRCLPLSSARRHPTEARAGLCRIRPRLLRNCSRPREGTGGPGLPALRRAFPRQALPFYRPPRPSSCRPCARARGLCADARNGRDRRGDGAAIPTRVALAAASPDKITQLARQSCASRRWVHKTVIARITTCEVVVIKNTRMC